MGRAPMGSVADVKWLDAIAMGETEKRFRRYTRWRFRREEPQAPVLRLGCNNTRNGFRFWERRLPSPPTSARKFCEHAWKGPFNVLNTGKRNPVLVKGSTGSSLIYVMSLAEGPIRKSVLPTKQRPSS